MGCLTWVSTWSSFGTQICDVRPEGIMENIFATHDFSSDLICCSFSSGVHFREREDDGREWLRGIFGIGSRSGQQVFFSVKTQWQVTRPNCNTGPTASKKERLICTGPKGAEIFVQGHIGLDVGVSFWPRKRDDVSRLRFNKSQSTELQVRPFGYHRRSGTGWSCGINSSRVSSSPQGQHLPICPRDWSQGNNFSGLLVSMVG
jgi:hypothetical protein